MMSEWLSEVAARTAAAVCGVRAYMAFGAQNGWHLRALCAQAGWLVCQARPERADERHNVVVRAWMGWIGVYV